MLSDKFKMKNLGKVKHFLGVDFTQSDGCVKMSRETYANRILEKFYMENCKTRESPCDQKLCYSEDAVKLLMLKCTERL